MRPVIPGSVGAGAGATVAPAPRWVARRAYTADRETASLACSLASISRRVPVSGRTPRIALLLGGLAFLVAAPATARKAPKPAAPAALPRLVDLGATKCIPCKLMAPALEELKKPDTEMVNMVKEIYEPFTDLEISDHIAVMLRPPEIRAEVKIVFQSVDGLHKACPGHTGDWYFTGNYPTPGGNKVANQSFINYFEGKNVRSY